MLINTTYPRLTETDVFLTRLPVFHFYAYSYFEFHFPRAMILSGDVHKPEMFLRNAGIVTRRLATYTLGLVMMVLNSVVQIIPPHPNLEIML